jgi:hypothetical protein
MPTATAAPIDWLAFLANGIGAALGTGIVGALGWLLMSSYFGEKAKNLATKQDIAAITREVEQVKAEFQQARDAQQHGNELALKSVDFEHQLRLAALERKLDAHQGAFTHWWELQGKVHGNRDEAWSAVRACQDFWVRHNVFLTPEARQAFYDAYFAAQNLIHLRDEPKDAESLRLLREWSATVAKAGNVIAQAVALPPFQLERLGSVTATENT